MDKPMKAELTLTLRYCLVALKVFQYNMNLLQTSEKRDKAIVCCFLNLLIAESLLLSNT